MTKRRTRMITTAGAVLALSAAGAMPAVAGHDDDHDTGELETVVDGLSGPRGVDALGHGRTLITEAGGTFSLVIERDFHEWRTSARHDDDHDDVKVIELGQIETGFAPAIAKGKNGRIWLLTTAGEEDDPTAARLFKWKWGWDEPVEVANIGEYQAEEDPDPYDLEDLPGESNPFGLAALKDGSVLVADAAGNDLLHVSKQGDIETVARLKPRMVEVPEGLEPAGETIPAEAVATSVTVGKDGYWYVGELRGYPATPGTSQIWRIKPGTTDAVCKPNRPSKGACKRFADGLTSIVDLASGFRGIYALSLSKMSWLAAEADDPPIPGAEIGGLFVVSKTGHHHDRHASHPNGNGVKIVELVPDQLVLPGGVDVAENPYVGAPIGAPLFPDPTDTSGALYKIN